MNEFLSQLKNGQNLSFQEMSTAMELIMSGTASDSDIEQFLLSLKKKGETVEEIAAAAKVMRQHGLKLSKSYPDLLDTCGTGGDGNHTLNVSTIGAIVAASAGAMIGKHGNRSVSSLCGSADLLEMLGIKIDLPVTAIEASLEKVGFGFFFAPQFHPAVRFAMPARKKIQGKTLFNVLGPLSNPGQAQYQLLGVYDVKLVEILAEALTGIGIKKALVVHGLDGLDEISIGAETKIAEVDYGKVRVFTIKPEDYGVARTDLAELQCQTKEECRDKALQVLDGAKGPAQDIVAMNAGAALYVVGKCASIQEGVALARKNLILGAAKKKLDEIVSFNKKMEALAG